VSLTPIEPTHQDKLMNGAGAAEERRAEGYVAHTQSREETLPCPECGQLALVRVHFLVVSESGQVEEWGHADRCLACEPFESRMPTAGTFERICGYGAVV
jgi:hypothetical protein